MRPSSTNRTSGSTFTSGWRSLSRSVSIQCVVAARPSSRPRWASTNAALQKETIRASGRMRAKAASSPAGMSGRSHEGPPTASTEATMTVSALASSSGPCSTLIVYPAVVRAGPPSREHTRTS